MMYDPWDSTHDYMDCNGSLRLDARYFEDIFNSTYILRNISVLTIHIVMYMDGYK